MHVWRERLSRWFDPLARRIPLSPNAISLIALALNVIAAVLLFQGRRQPLDFLIAVGFVSAGGLADALDGIVARVQGKTSRFGDFLDHCADRLSDMLLAICWLTGNSVRESLVIAAVTGVMLNGYIGTQIEATFHERNYDSVGRGEFVLALVIYPIVSYILFTNGWNALRFARLTIADWLATVMTIFAILGIVQRCALALRLERQS
jgi:archaetidylinositol phosphate synthase